MMLTKKSKALSLVAVATFVASPVVMADESGWVNEPGWYIGANVGQSTFKLDDTKIINNLLQPEISATAINKDDTDTAYKLFGGYQFNKYFAIEGGYFDLGEMNLNLPTNPLGAVNGTFKIRGINLDAVGFIPVTEKFSVFGRAGATYAYTRDRFNPTGAAQVTALTAGDHSTNYKLGLGLQYAFNESLAMRLEGEHYRVNDGLDNKGFVNVASLGLVYKFGAKKPAPHIAEPARETPPPPAPRFEKYTISATQLFAFDSADLRSPQPQLDDIAKGLKTANAPEKVSITGYTDRIGSDQYNQKLSEQRAAAVKDYLVSKGIDANRLETRGKGKADPIVVCNDKNRDALIKCLEPNRRGEVEKITIEKQVP